jgi:uncharacterized protein YdiU (UPF0061 family)
MARANPARIPRNHLVEEALEAAVQGDLTPFLAAVDRLARPYDRNPGSPVTDDRVPEGFDAGYRTFCGT